MFEWTSTLIRGIRTRFLRFVLIPVGSQSSIWVEIRTVAIQFLCGLVIIDVSYPVRVAAVCFNDIFVEHYCGWIKYHPKYLKEKNNKPLVQRKAGVAASEKKHKCSSVVSFPGFPSWSSFWLLHAWPSVSPASFTHDMRNCALSAAPSFAVQELLPLFSFQCIKGHTSPGPGQAGAWIQQNAHHRHHHVCSTISNIRQLPLRGPIYYRNRSHVFHVWHQLVRWVETCSHLRRHNIATIN